MLPLPCRPALLPLAVLAAVSAATPSSPFRPRHDDHHVAHPPPLLQLNESQVLQGHSPDPPSYWDHDFRPHDDPATNVRALIAFHVVGMTLAFFFLLPVAISLRSTKHPWHSLAVVSFSVLAFLSAAAASLYKKFTGDLYQGSIHGPHGYLVLALCSVLATYDAFALIRRAYTFLRGPDRKNIRLLWRNVVCNRGEIHNAYTSLAHDESDDYVESKLVGHDHHDLPSQPRRPVPIQTSHHPSQFNQDDWPPSASSNRTFVNHSYHTPRHSIASDDTLQPESHDSSDTHEGRPWLATVARLSVATAERVLVILAFMQLLSGSTVYTGICRGNYINGCMAHLIKGGIFWCYGLLSFGRYLGAWADLGWAWNRLPARYARNLPSAEMVESFVIFLYGATNTWMERFGAAPGSPYTTKQIQHISIAVMFWFAGMLGVALESKAFRRWLASPAYLVVKAEDAIAQPPSYTGSFNPFPALVIGVTGAAMSAHHQTYLFQVQIHALWGFFLTAFSVLRFLTYFFLWLRPPHSVLPSRPPTEALASFCLATGGLVFILSTEQITFAAMRHGHDDVMFFFNFAVAVTSLVFCWLLAITAFKGWVASRSPSPAQRPPAFSRRVVFDTDAQVA